MAKDTTLPPGLAQPRYQRKNKHTVKNSCANSSLAKRLTQQLAGIMAHLENHPGDNLSRTRVSNIQDLLRR